MRIKNKILIWKVIYLMLKDQLLINVLASAFISGLEGVYLKMHFKNEAESMIM